MLRPTIVMTCAVASAVLAGFAFTSLGSHFVPTAAVAATAAPAAPSDATSNPDDSTSVAGDDHVTAIPKAADGHFWANASVNDKAVRFLVDTGASVVVLTEADAQRLGIDKSSLVYDHKVITAMGTTEAAQVTLTSLSVGQSTVRNVPAMIIPQGGTSLLGMSYLGKLSRFEATPSSLILHP